MKSFLLTLGLASVCHLSFAEDEEKRQKGTVEVAEIQAADVATLRKNAPQKDPNAAFKQGV
jgi:hypothetical protein